MNNTNDLARIDRYTCKFENPVMEDRFMAEKWKRVKKPISFAIIFFASFGGSFLGMYLYDFGIFHAITFGSLVLLLFMPLDHWIHLQLLKKSKLREQKQNE